MDFPFEPCNGHDHLKSPSHSVLTVTSAFSSEPVSAFQINIQKIKTPADEHISALISTLLGQYAHRELKPCRMAWEVLIHTVDAETYSLLGAFHFLTSEVWAVTF